MITVTIEKPKKTFLTYDQVKQKRGVYMPVDAHDCRLFVYSDGQAPLYCGFGRFEMCIREYWQDRMFVKTEENIEIKFS